MKRKHLDFDVYLQEALQDPEIKAEHDRLQPEFALIRALIDAREKKGFTQEKLAQAMGTKQSVISRLESGKANPSIGFLKKLAEALHSHLEIKFIS